MGPWAVKRQDGLAIGQPVFRSLIIFILEATGGFEPPIEVLQTSALTTWLRRPAIHTGRLVPRVGFEPTQAIAHGPLKTACLPVPPPRPIRKPNGGCVG